MSFIQRFLRKEPEKLREEDIQRFINRKLEENENLNYKDKSLLENPEKIGKHVCAFANTNGGLLVLGVTEKRQRVGKRKIKIYPGNITWAGPSATKEKLEKNLKTQNSPEVPLRIVPVRKSKEDPKLIFLLDIPKSNKLHMHKKSYRFYKRRNFESDPMAREEVIDFIKIKLSYERCARFRHSLKNILVDFMDSVFVRLGPHPIDQTLRNPHKLAKWFKNFISTPLEKIENTITQTEIVNIFKFNHEMSVNNRLLQEADSLPHDDITPEEQLLFDRLKHNINGSLDIQEFTVNEAHYHKVPEGWQFLTCMEFAEATKEPEHFLKYLSGFVRSLIWLSNDIVKLHSIFEEMQKRYGPFESCKVFKI